MWQRDNLEVFLQTGFCPPPGFQHNQEAFAPGPAESSPVGIYQESASPSAYHKRGLTPLGPHPGPVNTRLSSLGYNQ